MADLLRVFGLVDDTYRRRMNRQLTVQESRHKPTRDVCHGKRATIHQAYRDGTEGQVGSLGLVPNAVVLWTTRCIDATSPSCVRRGMSEVGVPVGFRSCSRPRTLLRRLSPKPVAYS
ncbi:transposase [Streptomyces sp. NBC_01235]|nr:transposase [Streptomyces sp. NBC_01235]